MPRLTPKRLRKQEYPPDPPLRPPIGGALRVARPFNHKGLEFRVGDVVSIGSPVVLALFQEHPAYFKVGTGR